ncbi:S8 family serine peptidase [Flavobacterium luminosum]|uniref:S8 family serine peptidase n=1 Tax=Flavobacterium luminosum TaxID=2949086 RepID=A0ABT0TN66_9FLAO|nr:S8 family serine peptidase [Flavobacterium sp. HXWNR70]MCL9808939.1 S8 family serine peptidase [Flavobacterium sp. HXWNR70]
MKNIFLSLLLITSTVFGQNEEAWVYFLDKPNASHFFNNPLSELSQRSLDRRTTQGIALDTKDAPLEQTYLDQIAASNGITVLAKSKWLNGVHVRGTQIAIAALSALSFVHRIQYANHALNTGGRVASKSAQPYNVINKGFNTKTAYNYGSSATQIQMLNAQVLHQQNFTGAGKIVAIMDAGFPGVNTTEPFQHLRDNGLILGGYNYVNRSSNFYIGHPHGTMVLSTMGAITTNLVGTAPDAHYYLFITEDVASESPVEESYWVEAAEQADRLGVDVINTSLGYFSYDNPNYSYSYTQMNGQVSVIARATDIAFSRGMICVSSAGNSGSTTQPNILTPADAAMNITVGAVNATETRSSFSSIGPTADNRIKPDVMAMGTASVVANETGTVHTADGTSFASPILAGAITSFWSAFPSKTNTEIVQLIKASADRYSTPDIYYGYGIPDFQTMLNKVLTVNEVEDSKMEIYPNPVKDVLTIAVLEASLPAQIEIYTTFGQKIMSQRVDYPKQNITLPTVPSGIYFYKLSNGKASASGKLIKQ